MSIIPISTPKLALKEVEAIINKAKKSGNKNIYPDDVVFVVAIRGYRKKSMGDPTKNDRGIYDDAIFIVSPSHFSSWNANVDPGAFRKGIANLKEGIWRYRPGPHGITFNRPGYPYPAFVQAAPVTVVRDCVGDDTGWFGINIHRGSNNSVSSLGCQTLPPKIWDSLESQINFQLKTQKQKSFAYILISQ